MPFEYKYIRLTQMGWFLPFAFIALICLALLRPLPTLPIPQNYRNVVDAKGITIPIEEPFRGIAFTWGTGIGPVGFLEATKDPHEIIKAGTPKEQENISKQIIGRIYPQILKNELLTFQDQTVFFHRNRTYKYVCLHQFLLPKKVLCSRNLQYILQ